MHVRIITILLLLCTATSCTTISIPPYASPVNLPVASASCRPLPEGLTLYGGTPLAEIERQGRFPMQYPERRFLQTSNPLWREFREGLEPTDLIFEYVHDEGSESAPFHHGGISAFRNGCTIKIAQVWIT